MQVLIKDDQQSVTKFIKEVVATRSLLSDSTKVLHGIDQNMAHFKQRQKSKENKKSKDKEKISKTILTKVVLPRIVVSCDINGCMPEVAITDQNIKKGLFLDLSSDVSRFILRFF